MVVTISQDTSQSGGVPDAHLARTLPPRCCCIVTPFRVYNARGHALCWYWGWRGEAVAEDVCYGGGRYR